MTRKSIRPSIRQKILTCAKSLFPPVVPAVAFFLLPFQTAYADEAAEHYIQTIFNETYPVLQDATHEEMIDTITAIVDRYVDFQRIARFTLGQYARQITDDQKKIFYPLFSEYTTFIYRKFLTDYSGQKFYVTGSVDRSPSDIIVNTGALDPAPGSRYDNFVVHWRVYRDKSGEMHIVDAGVQNIWLSIEQRIQFTSVISSNGGGARGIDALITQLQNELAKQKSP